jgi:uncharacterized protein YlxP (DUF503 family)
MPVAVLRMHFHISICSSLKEKRSLIKPILLRLHREFNLSTAEIDLQDQWHEAILECAMAGSDRAFLQKALQEVLDFSITLKPGENLALRTQAYPENFFAHHLVVFRPLANSYPFQ